MPADADAVRKRAAAKVYLHQNYARLL